MSGCQFVAVALAAIMVMASQEANAQANGNGNVKAPILITQKDFGKEIKAKNGDVLEVRLPMLMPLSWAIKEDQRPLTPVAGFPKSESVPPNPDSSVPTLGAGEVWINRYTVSTDRAITVPVAWMYCRKGEIALTKERLEKKIIPTPPDFRADLKRTELREGMIFKLTLEIQP